MALQVSVWLYRSVCGRLMQQSVRLDFPARMFCLAPRRGRLQDVAESELHCKSLWRAPGALGCPWNPWDCSITNIEIVLQLTRTIVSAVEGQTRRQSTSSQHDAHCINAAADSQPTALRHRKDLRNGLVV